MLRKKFIATGVSAVLAMGLVPAVALAEGAEVTVVEGDAIELQAADETTASFSFTNSGVTVLSGSTGYKIEGTTLTITEAGTYHISGSCSEGNIVVKKGATGVVLVLGDLSLTCSTTAPIAINKTAQATIDVEGTVTLTDAEDPATEESNDDYEGAVIKVKSGASLALTGTGTLTANGTADKNGIKGGSEATITVDSLTLNVTAANTGLASDGTVVINGGTVNVTADNDGIKSSPDEGDEASAGEITINGGTVNVTAGDNGIKADNVLNVLGGTVNVSAADDAVKAEHTLNVGATGTTGPKLTVSKSYEGLEAAEVNIYSGTLDITASDDGINAANGDLAGYAFKLNIAGGTTTVDAGGDGLDSNGDIVVSGGTTVVFSSTQGDNNAIDYGDFGSSWTWTGGTIVGIGMNSMQGTPTGGTYVGFGISGGMGGGFGGQRGGGFGLMGSDDEGSTASESLELQAPGGMGGSQMGGQQQGGFGGQAGGQQQGGAMGVAGGVSISAGDQLVVQDENGNTIFSTTAKKSANSVIMQSDALTSGSTYTLYVNGSQIASSQAAAGSGSVAGGTGGQQGQTPDSGQQQGGQQPGQMPGGAGGPDGQQPGGQPQTATDYTAVTGYRDVAPDTWYTSAVQQLKAAGIMLGYDNGSFGVGDNLTRGQFVTMLWRYANDDAAAFDTKQSENRTSFADLPDGTYYTEAANWAFEAGVVNGIENADGTRSFGANRPIKAEEVVAILRNLSGDAQLQSLSVLERFNDADAISDWAAQSMAWAVSNDVLHGSNGNLNPTEEIARERAAVILANALNNGLL